MAQKVLFINQEVIPYVPDSAMSNLGRKLPAAIVASGSEIRTFMPRWGNVNERRNQLHEVQRLSGMNINIDDTDHPLLIKVASIAASHMQVYFIDNSDYFTGRLMREDEHGNEYSDNVERTIFYARGILETVKKLRWSPDIIVCQGWICNIIPFYIRTAFKDEPAFAHCKIISTFFREQLTLPMPDGVERLISFRDGNEALLTETGIDFKQNDALIRLAAAYSDGVWEVGTSKEISEAIASVHKGPSLKLKTLDNLQDQFDNFVKGL